MKCKYLILTRVSSVIFNFLRKNTDFLDAERKWKKRDPVWHVSRRRFSGSHIQFPGSHIQFSGSHIQFPGSHIQFPGSHILFVKF